MVHVWIAIARKRGFFFEPASHALQTSRNRPAGKLNLDAIPFMAKETLAHSERYVGRGKASECRKFDIC